MLAVSTEPRRHFRLQSKSKAPIATKKPEKAQQTTVQTLPPQEHMGLAPQKPKKKPPKWATISPKVYFWRETGDSTYLRQARNFTFKNEFSKEAFLAKCHWHFSPWPLGRDLRSPRPMKNPAL